MGSRAGGIVKGGKAAGKGKWSQLAGGRKRDKRDKAGATCGA